MATPNDIANLTARLSAAYPNWNVSALTNEVYYEDLKDIATEELILAVRHCRTSATRDQRFAPSAGEIRQAVGELRGMSNNVPSSFAAWNEFKRAVVTSNYNNPQWTHPLIERTANLIGAREYGRSDVDDEPSWRARFIQCFDQLQERAERENLLLPEVRGYIETNGGRMLAPVDQMKQLAERMAK